MPHGAGAQIAIERVTVNGENLLGTVENASHTGPGSFATIGDRHLCVGSKLHRFRR
jgi:hypothetical protein